MPIALLAPDDVRLVAEIDRLEREGALEPCPSSRQPSWTKLHWMAVSSRVGGDEVTLQAYVAKGLSVNAQDVDGNTPLHMAAWNQNEERVEILLALGANPNLPNTKGNLPIHQAIRKKNWAIADNLAEAGSDLEFSDRLGLSALAWWAKQTMGEIQHSDRAQARLWQRWLDLPPAAWEKPASDGVSAMGRLTPIRQAEVRAMRLDRTVLFTDESTVPNAARRLRL